MINVIANNENRITREYLSNKWKDIDYKDRLIKSNAVDLNNNSIIEDIGNGYIRILPKDKNKNYK